MRADDTQIHHFECLKPLLTAAACCLAIATLARVAEIAWLHDRVAASDGLGFVLLQGLRFDLVTVGMLFALPLAVTPLLSLGAFSQRVWISLSHYYALAVIGLFVLMEVATPPFIAEYDVRPNFLLIEYLKYPREVLSMLFAGYKAELLAAAVLVPAATWFFHRRLTQSAKGLRRSHRWSALPLALLCLVVCTAAARSTLDHRPVNPSTVAFSDDTLVNSLPLNSLYTLMYAVYELRHEDHGFVYGEVPAEESVAAIHRAMALPESAFVDPAIPTLHFQQATREREQPLNLVIIVEESLGAEFVGRLGGLPLTPRLDELGERGIWLENLYATGTRSARGLEAIVTGFPPTSSQSVLKLGRAQQGFFTLGDYLGSKGYETSFIYGGEAQFDNMRRFFANNGFKTVIDKGDFESPSFMGSWGVADEVLFQNAHQRFLEQAGDKPFFSVLFTTSNHSPWEFPDGRIELYEEPRATVANAVKYADYALGEFFELAQQSPYWENTVFLVVADHNSRVYGAELVPIERFHIPGLILGGSIEPASWSRTASQIDLLPTLLSLIGVNGYHPAPGLDLTRPDIDDIPERAMMQYAGTQAYLEDKTVTILRKQQAPAQFTYDGRYSDATPQSGIMHKAQALSAWPVRAYRERSYRLSRSDEAKDLRAELAAIRPPGG